MFILKKFTQTRKNTCMFEPTEYYDCTKNFILMRSPNYVAISLGAFYWVK